MADQVADEVVVRLTAQMAELDAGMAQAAATVEASSKAMADSTVQAAAVMSASAQAAADAEVAATARIHAMVEASLADKAKQMAATMAITDATRQNTFTSSLGSAAEADMADAETDRAEAEIAAMGTTAGLTGATEANTAATIENAAAQDELSSSFATGNATREYGALLDEVMSGNFRRMRGTTVVLANRTGLLRMAFSGLGLAVIGVTAAVAGLAFAFIEGEEETSKFNQAFQESGGAIGVTISQFQEMGYAIAGADASIGHAKEALLAIADTGRFTGQQIQLVGKGALDMADVTGLSIKQTVADFTSLEKSPVEAVVKLNDQYHFLTVSTYNQIAALQAEGKTSQAASVAEDALAASFAARAKTVDDNLGDMQKAARATGHFFSSMWDDIMGIGRTETTGEKITVVNGQIANLKSEIAAAPNNATAQALEDILVGLEKEKAGYEATENAAETAAQAQAAAAKKIDDAITSEKKQPKLVMVKFDPDKINQELQATMAKVSGVSIKTPELTDTASMIQEQVDLQLQTRNGAIAAQAAIDATKQHAANEVVVVNQLANTVSDAFSTTVKGVIMGTQSWTQGLHKMWQSIELEFVSMTIRLAMHWLAMEATKTAASIAGDRVRTMSAADSADMQVLSDVGGAIKTIVAKGWQAAASVYASVAEIPFVGWILAPAAAAAAAYEVLNFASRISSAAGGWENIPQDQLAMVHKNEMVLPAPIAEAARNTFRGGGQRGGTTNHYHVNAMDSRSMEQALRRNPGALGKALHHASRMGAL